MSKKTNDTTNSAQLGSPGSALVLYSSTAAWIDDERLQHDLARLPPKEQDRIRRLRRPEAQRASLVGRLLLNSGLRLFGLQDNPLAKLNYTSFGKPYLPGDLSFSISHSGDYVVCAIAHGTRVGIDIEAVLPIAWSDVEDTMDSPQWRAIHSADRPLQRFYAFWTMKESLSKCRGEGLNLSFDAMTGTGPELRYDGEPWSCQPLAVAPGLRLPRDRENPARQVAYPTRFMLKSGHG